MKFYDEQRMKGVRDAFETEVMEWQGVTAKEMMGCLCYFRGKKFFAFLVTGGLVLTKLEKEDRDALLAREGSKPFEMAGRTASTWVQLPVKKPGDLGALLPFARKSYERAAAR